MQKRWVAVPEWARVISTPLGLLISKFPSEFADAIRSPIEALLMAVITELTSEVLEKSTVLPFIETWDAEGKFVKSKPNVTKLNAEAVTLVDEEIAFIETALAEAEELVDVPNDISLIFILCEFVKALDETKAEVIIVLGLFHWNQNLLNLKYFQCYLHNYYSLSLVQFLQMFHQHFLILNNLNKSQL